MDEQPMGTTERYRDSVGRELRTCVATTVTYEGEQQRCVFFEGVDNPNVQVMKPREELRRLVASGEWEPLD